MPSSRAADLPEAVVTRYGVGRASNSGPMLGAGGMGACAWQAVCLRMSPPASRPLHAVSLAVGLAFAGRRAPAACAGPATRQRRSVRPRSAHTCSSRFAACWPPSLAPPPSLRTCSCVPLTTVASMTKASFRTCESCDPHVVSVPFRVRPARFCTAATLSTSHVPPIECCQRKQPRGERS